MERKLVKMGEYSLMAAIPMKWIKKNHLKVGDKINFAEVDNNLVLSSRAEVFEKKIKAHIKSSKIEVIWRTIQPIYTSGYDEATITFENEKTLQVLEKILPNLIGFEIIETGENKIIIKSLVHHSDEEFDNILRRTFLTLTHISDVLNKGFEETKRLEEIKLLEMTINKYTMFLKRLINRKGYKYPHYMYSMVTFIELASNHFEYIRRYLKHNLKNKIEKSWRDDSIKLSGLIKEIYDLNYNYSEEKFEKIALAQPHFFWFDEIKDCEIKSNFKSIAEYAAQISRLIKANNM